MHLVRQRVRLVIVALCLVISSQGFAQDKTVAGNSDTNAQRTAGTVMDVNEHDADYDRKAVDAFRKDLPQVFSCGDSISVGYAPFLKGQLKDRCSVLHRNDLEKLFGLRHGYTGLAHSLIALTRRVLELDKYEPDYLLLNCGLHDVYRGKGGIAAYRANLKTIIKLADQHRVTLIWVTTTKKAKGDPKSKIVEQYNKEAINLVREAGHQVIDLGAHCSALITKHGEEKILSKDKVHFTPFGREQQAIHLAEKISGIVKLPAASK